MRLLNTETLELEEFFNPPEYAILSHRWGPDEVTYERYLTQRDLKGQGYDKIVNCCRFARGRGRKYVWIDTCCIDKRSSAELSEAINSMWEWYESAHECYAHLADVTAPLPGTANASLSFSRIGIFDTKDSHASEWFSRGWTLQELLAPRILIFCADDWQVIGLKEDLGVLAEVSQITSIPERRLASHFSLTNSCVAEKLSWAARRVTTRDEDIAYCLLGLLGINMPLLYGEGKKAWLRLQQEIIRNTDDESIFAWQYGQDSSYYPLEAGILAPKVSDFIHSGSVRLLDQYREPYTLTNKGLDLTVSCVRTKGTRVYVIPLNCTWSSPAVDQPALRCSLAIRKERETGLFLRINVHDLGQNIWQFYSRTTYLPLEKRFVIRLSRWHHEYEPAIGVLRRFIKRTKEGQRHPAEDTTMIGDRRHDINESVLDDSVNTQNV
ncbi:hypothetical protein Q7P37_009187 [Cladosporium fusiforme]